MYRTNPETGERELVIEINRGHAIEDPLRPSWLHWIWWIAALLLVYRATR